LCGFGQAIEIAIRLVIEGDALMADDSSTFVTRRELYSSLSLVWLYILLVLGDLLRIDWRWSTGILWGAALFMSLFFTFSAWKLRQRSASEKKKLIEIPKQD
jgi:hypothetical protein